MTKLEQVARAIAQARFNWLEQHGPYSDDPIGDEVPAEILARTAIQAMREPTVEMCEDGAQALEKYNPNLRAMREAFRAMIDQVLAEGGE